MFELNLRTFVYFYLFIYFSLYSFGWQRDYDCDYDHDFHINVEKEKRITLTHKERILQLFNFLFLISVVRNGENLFVKYQINRRYALVQHWCRSNCNQ